MIDFYQAAVGLGVLVVAVGALLYLFYSRTNAVEKTGYGALIMLAIVSLMIPVFWIMENNGQAMANVELHNTAVQRGAALYAQYCFTCHGTQGQGRVGPKLNNNSVVNQLSDDDVHRIISGGVYNQSDLSKAIMPAWSDRYGGPLTDNDIQYLFELIRSSDPQYLAAHGYTGNNAVNGFTLVKSYLQSNNPTGYQTAVAAETTGQFGNAVDMTGQKTVSIEIQQPPPGATCSPACYQYSNLKVKVGTVITWVNKSSTPHTVSAIEGTNIAAPTVAPQIFDSGIANLIQTNGTYSYTVTQAAYDFNKDHTVIYYCQIHPGMIAELTIVP